MDGIRNENNVMRNNWLAWEGKRRYCGDHVALAGEADVVLSADRLCCKSVGMDL